MHPPTVLLSTKKAPVPMSTWQKNSHNNHGFMLKTCSLHTYMSYFALKQNIWETVL